MTTQKSFTLIEIIIVVVILGLMAILAIPKIVGAKAQAIFSEGVSALNTLHAAQVRYYFEKSKYASVCADLDVAVTPKNFKDLVCKSSGEVLLTLNEKTTYTLQVDSAGKFTCTGDGCTQNLKNVCPNKCV